MLPFFSFHHRLAGKVMPILVLYQIGDVLQTVFQGVFRGCGRQRIGAIVDFCSFYLLALPMAYVLGLVLDYGMMGLWWAMVIGVVCEVGLAGYCVFGINWQHESDAAAARVSTSESTSGAASSSSSVLPLSPSFTAAAAATSGGGHGAIQGIATRGDDDPHHIVVHSASAGSGDSAHDAHAYQYHSNQSTTAIGQGRGSVNGTGTSSAHGSRTNSHHNAAAKPDLRL